MKKSIDPQLVARKLKAWKDQKGVSMKKIGEILSPEEEKTTEKNYITYYKRAERFLKGNPAMRINDLNKICEFTEKPLLHFVTEDPRQCIEAALDEMGKSQDEIQGILQAL